MKKLIVVSLTVLVVGCTKKEPVYKGKSVSDWHQSLRDDNVMIRRQAAVALGELGPDAAASIMAGEKRAQPRYQNRLANKHGY